MLEDHTNEARGLYKCALSEGWSVPLVKIRFSELCKQTFTSKRKANPENAENCTCVKEDKVVLL